MSMKNSGITIGNQTHRLPACSAVPKPTAPRSTPLMHWQTTETTGSWHTLSSGCWAAGFSEMVLTAYKNTQCHDVEDHSQNIGLLNKFFFYLIFFVSLPNVFCVCVESSAFIIIYK